MYVVLPWYNLRDTKNYKHTRKKLNILIKIDVGAANTWTEFEMNDSRNQILYYCSQRNASFVENSMLPDIRSLFEFQLYTQVSSFKCLSAGLLFA